MSFNLVFIGFIFGIDKAQVIDYNGGKVVKGRPLSCVKVFYGSQYQYETILPCIIKFYGKFKTVKYITDK